MRQPLITLDDVPDGGAIPVEFFGREVLVLRDGDDVRAVANVCPHIGGPLSRCNGRLVCGWHTAEFDAKTMSRLKGPAKPGSEVMVVPTKVFDGVLTYVWDEE